MEKVITPEFRVSFPNMHTPKAIMNGKPKYSIMMLIPKSTDMAGLRSAMKAAAVAKWGDKMPANLHNPIKDGDTDLMTDGTLRSEKYPEMAGHWIVSASSLQKPGLVDQNVQPIMDEGQFYAGCYARAAVHAFAYGPNKTNPMMKSGVSFGLNNVQMLRDGESFSGSSKPEEDFGPASPGSGEAVNKVVAEDNDSMFG